MYPFLILLTLLVTTRAGADDRFQLGPSKWFENMVMCFECRPLEIGDRFVAWVHEPVVSGNRIVFRECYEEKDASSFTSGDLKEGWYWIDLNAPPEIKTLVLSRLDDFSQPSFCGEIVAYWGRNLENDVWLIVARVADGKILKEKPLGKVFLETDYFGYLNRAKWEIGCRRATFFHEEFLQEPVVFDLESNPRVEKDAR
jgi:hypothetical protein